MVLATAYYIQRPVTSIGWTPEARAFLQANYWKLSVKEIAETLGTTQPSIRGQMFRMGLERGNVEAARAQFKAAAERLIQAELAKSGWNETKINWLLANYKTTKLRELSAVLNRSMSDISNKLASLGHQKLHKHTVHPQAPKYVPALVQAAALIPQPVKGAQSNRPSKPAPSMVTRAQLLAAPGWNKAKDEYLMTHYQTMTLTQIGTVVGASQSKVSVRLNQLGIQKGSPSITTFELLKRIRSFRAEFGHYPVISSVGWKSEDLQGCNRHGIPDASTVRRRFNGCLQEAWAAAEGKPVALTNVKNRHLSIEQKIDIVNVYKHLTGHIPVCLLLSNRPWREEWLTQRLAVPNYHGLRKHSLTGQPNIFHLLHTRPLNKALLASYGLTPEEITRARGLYH